MISETITKATGPQPSDSSTSILQRQECRQQFKGGVSSLSKRSSDWIQEKKKKIMLYSEALRQFVHRSRGISTLGGTQHFTGQHTEKPDLTLKPILL